MEWCLCYGKYIKPLGVPKFQLDRRSGAVDGRLLDTVGCTQLTLHLGNEVVDVNFRILKNIQAAIILSNNVLKLCSLIGP